MEEQPKYNPNTLTPKEPNQMIVNNLEDLTDALLNPTEDSRIIVVGFPIVHYSHSDKDCIFGLRTICADTGNMVFNLLRKEKRVPCSAFRMPHYSVNSEITLGRNVKLFESYEEQEQIDEKYAFNFLIPNTHTVERVKDYRHICFDKEKRELLLELDYHSSNTFYETNSREFQVITKAQLKSRKAELGLKRVRFQNYNSIISHINPERI